MKRIRRGKYREDTLWAGHKNFKRLTGKKK